MSDTNGSHVTWRELNLLRQTLDQRFDVLEEKLDALVGQRRARWRAWGPPLVAAVISAGVAAVVAVLVG